MGELLAIILFILIGGPLLGLYIFNIRKLLNDIKAEKYSIMTILRIIGVPFPFIGIVMGAL
jgi:hypothetical protein